MAVGRPPGAGGEPPPQALLARGQQAFGAGDVETALRLAEQTLAREPANPAARQLAAVAERRLGRPDAARGHFEAALRAAPRDPHILNSFANLLKDLGELGAARDTYRRALEADPGHVEALVNLAAVLKQLGERAEAHQALTRAVAMVPGHARAWHSLGLLMSEDGDPTAAATALDRSLTLQPRNPAALSARGAVAADLGEPGAPYLARARELDPQDRTLALAEAMAFQRAADPARARALLSTLVDRDPGFADGQAALARLLWQAGETEGFVERFEAALARLPMQADLWRSYFGALMLAGRAEQVLERLPAARPALGELSDRFEAVASAEVGDVARADRAFSSVDLMADPGLQIAYVRHLLRARRADAAAAFALPIARAAGGQWAWSYLATSWRLLEDPRWAWLEGDPAFVQAVDLPIDARELSALAARLRGLHRSHAAPLDQTLRGGTQTEGSLLSRREPEIAHLRGLFEAAIGDYIAQLPPVDETHPLLSVPRAGFRISASWSVRLTDRGYHVNHVHPRGWLSSAFYVALPDEVGDQDADQRGWLTFGAPPAELGLDLAPFRTLRPAPGRLALFPSTLWHGTRPFDAGERLTAAFDVWPQNLDKLSH